MKETLTTIDVRKSLGDILNRVDLRHDEFIIERKGRPLAALVPVQKLAQMERLARRHVIHTLELQRPGQPSQREADEIANAAKHATRRRR